MSTRISVLSIILLALATQAGAISTTNLPTQPPLLAPDLRQPAPLPAEPDLKCDHETVGKLPGVPGWSCYATLGEEPIQATTWNFYRLADESLVASHHGPDVG